MRMAVAGAQGGRRLVPVGAHPVEDVVLGAIEINQDVAGASGSGERARKTSRHVRSNY